MDNNSFSVDPTTFKPAIDVDNIENENVVQETPQTGSLPTNNMTTVAEEKKVESYSNEFKEAFDNLDQQVQEEFNQTMEERKEEVIKEQVKEAIQDVVTSQPQDLNKLTTGVVSPFIYKKFDFQKYFLDLQKPFFLPSGQLMDSLILNLYIREHQKDLENDAKSILSTLVSNLSQEEIIALSQSDKNNFFNQAYEYNLRSLDKNQYINKLNYANRDIEIKKTQEKFNGTAAENVKKFLTMVGISHPVTIPLWHSGFTITCSAPTQLELSKLEYELYAEEVKVGRETSGFITSNRKGFAMDTITNFILSKIEETTLDIDDSEDIREFISILDFDLILTGLISAGNADKIEICRPCSNSKELVDGEEGSSIKCGSTITGTLAPSKMIYVNKDMVSKDMLDIISRTSPGSVSKEDLNKYHYDLNKLIDSKPYNEDGDTRRSHYDAVIGNQGLTTRIEFKIPSIYDYLDSSLKWINLVTKNIEDIVTSDSDSKVDLVVSDILSISVVGLLSSNVKNISVLGSDIEYSDTKDIVALLTNIRPVGDFNQNFQKEITDYTIASTIAVAGIPNYVCPKCQQLQSDNEDRVNVYFQDIIPLDMTAFFSKLMLHQSSIMESMAQM